MADRTPDRYADAESIVAALDPAEAKRRLARIMHEAARTVDLINRHLPDPDLSDIASGRLSGSRDTFRTVQRLAIDEI